MNWHMHGACELATCHSHCSEGTGPPFGAAASPPYLHTHAHPHAGTGPVLHATAPNGHTAIPCAFVRSPLPHSPYSTHIHPTHYPAPQAAIANAPGPGERPTSGAGGAAVASPRDAAACALALLALASETPDLYVAVRTSGFYQSLAVLYQRTIDPDQTSGAVLPADAAALLLRAVTLPPSSRWAASLGRGAVRAMERQLEVRGRGRDRGGAGRGTAYRASPDC